VAELFAAVLALNKRFKRFSLRRSPRLPYPLLLLPALFGGAVGGVWGVGCSSMVGTRRGGGVWGAGGRGGRSGNLGQSGQLRARKRDNGARGNTRAEGLAGAARAGRAADSLLSRLSGRRGRFTPPTLESIYMPALRFSVTSMPPLHAHETPHVISRTPPSPSRRPLRLLLEVLPLPLAFAAQLAGWPLAGGGAAVGWVGVGLALYGGLAVVAVGVGILGRRGPA
jgi:hypothetical protein